MDGEEILDIEVEDPSDLFTGLSKREAAKSVWFGPRLGKRDKRSLESKAEANEALNLAELLKDAPWALIALKGKNMDILIISHYLYSSFRPKKYQ